MTRSGRAIGTPSHSPGDTESTRASQSPKARRTQRKKTNAKKGGPVIEQPLSVLTKDYETPVKDMGKWANRSVETRMAEVEKKKGYISRPMNSFMLYRSAYAERVKQFCKENNHQVVSQVTGASWPLEPREVRELYERYAIMERDNHAAAHPNYKFAPNKAGKRPRNDDNDSDSDDEWGGSGKSSKRSRSARRADSRSASSTPFDDNRPQLYHQVLPTQHPMGYDMGHQYGRGTIIFNHGNGMMGEYFQTTQGLVPYDYVSEAMYRITDDPFQSHQSMNGLVAMPRAEHPELLAAYPQQQQQMMQVQAGIIDPQLEQMDTGYQMEYYDENAQSAHQAPRTIAYGSPPQMGHLNYQQEQGFHPGMATLTADDNVWSDQAPVGAEFEAEFAKID
jgi:hypothetical protein